MKAVLFRLDPERAHDLALRAARAGGSGLARLLGGRPAAGLERDVLGLRFPNPLGLAAGLDKNGVALPFWRALGFGFVEVGTVTPRPQPGNPRPRVWRFPPHRALGNRLGFPSDGAAMVAARLKRDKLHGDIVGINLGKNAETPLARAADDYLAALEATRSVADYFVVNVSSPNTPGLRELQSRQYLADLVGRVRERAGRPLLVKLSPDLDEGQLEDAVEACRAAGAHGLVLVNTTLARPEGIAFDGGLSGRPLAARARELLAEARRRAPELPVVSVGGIDGPEEARARLAAGASLVQVYTGLVYEGPGLVAKILEGLAA